MSQKFDVQKVTDLANRISGAEADVVRLGEIARKAASELNSAETRLSNLRSEFTRAAESQLDPHNCPERPKSYPVEASR